MYKLCLFKTICIKQEICHWYEKGNAESPSVLWRHHVAIYNSTLRVTGLCERNSPVTDKFPHKGPVMRKIFPFNDVIIYHIFLVSSVLIYISTHSMRKVNALRHGLKSRHLWTKFFNFDHVSVRVQLTMSLGCNEFIPNADFEYIFKNYSISSAVPEIW